MKRLLAILLVWAGLIVCPVLMYSSNVVYSRILSSVYSVLPFLEHVFGFAGDYLDDMDMPNLLGVISMGIVALTGFLFVISAQKISPSQYGMRFFLSGSVGIICSVYGGICCFTDGVTHWSFWKGGTLQWVHLFGLTLHPIMLFNASICMLILSYGYISEAAPLELLFGSKYRTVFYAIHPDYIARPPDNISLEYRPVNNQQTFYATFSSNGLNYSGLPLLNICCIKDNRRLFDAGHILLKSKLQHYVRNVFCDFNAQQKSLKTQAEKITYPKNIREITIKEIIQLQELQRRINVRDFLILHGKAKTLEEFNCSDVLQVHIEPDSMKVSFHSKTYLCTLVMKTLDSKTVSLKNIPALTLKGA